MKKILFFSMFLFLAISTSTYAQDEVPQPRTIETTEGTQLIAMPTSENRTEETRLIAQEDEVPEPRTIETSEGTENVAVPTSETTEDAQPELIAVEEEQIFTIYTHEECPHCAVVEEFVELNELEENVDYIQLKDNEDNLDAMKEEWERFDVSEEEEGWPFAIYTVDEEELYAVGDQPIIEAMTDVLGIEDPVTEGETDDGSINYFLFILGGVFFVAIIGYGIYSYIFNKEEE